MNVNDPLVAPSFAPVRAQAQKLLVEVRAWQRREAGTLDMSPKNTAALMAQVALGEAEKDLPLGPEDMLIAVCTVVTAFVSGFTPLSQRAVWEQIGRGVAQGLAELDHWKRMG